MVIRWVLEMEMPKKRLATQVKYLYFLGFIEKKFGNLKLNELTLEKFERWIEGLRSTKFVAGIQGNRGYYPPHYRKSFEDFAKYLSLIYRIAYAHKWTRHRMVFPNPDHELILTRH